MAGRGALLKWSPETWKRWSVQPRLSLTRVPRTKFLLLKAPLSTVYEEKYGDRNVFTVPMYVQRLIAKGIAAGLVIDCASLDLHLFDKDTTVGSLFYFHNSAEWDDFGVDYHKLTPKSLDSSESIIPPSTIEEFMDVCAGHWKNNPTLHIAIFDSRGGNGVASFLIAYYLCLKLKAPVHTALAIVEKASPNSSSDEQKGLCDSELMKQLQERFQGKKEIKVDLSKFPSWWFASNDSSASSETITIAPKEMGKRKSEGESASQESKKRSRVQSRESSPLPLEALSSNSQRYNRAIKVLKQITNIQSTLSRVPIREGSKLTDENISKLRVAKCKVTWKSVGRRGLLLILTDGIFFLENGDADIRLSILTCPLYIPNPQKPSVVQHRTLLDVSLVVDREKNNVNVPRFLILDALIYMGGKISHKPFSQRLKYIQDLIFARKKSSNIWNYQKEGIRMRAQEFFDLGKTEYFFKNVLNAQFHETDGMCFVPEGSYYPEGNNYDEAIECKSDDKEMIGKVLANFK